MNEFLAELLTPRIFLYVLGSLFIATFVLSTIKDYIVYRLWEHRNGRR